MARLKQENTINRITGVFYFVGLALAWGSSYAWIKVALREIPPTEIVALRAFIAALILSLIALVKKTSFRLSIKTWNKLFLLSSLSIVIPFLLLSWGVSQISSALSGVLNGTVPLFTVLVAHFSLADERISTEKLLGLGLGFLGSYILMQEKQGGMNSVGLSSAGRNPTLGALAVLSASLCYGCAAVYARKYLGHVGALQKAVSVTVIAALCLGAIHGFRLYWFQESFLLPRQPLTWAAVLWMGVVGSSLAYIAYFWLISSWGATRVAFVMYLAPVFALVIGAVFLGETVGPRLILGSALILSGVAVAQFKKHYLLSTRVPWIPHQHSQKPTKKW